MRIMHKRIGKTAAVLLSLALCVTGAPLFEMEAMIVHAQNDNERLSEIKNQIDATKKERDELKESMTNIKKVRDSLQQNKDDLDNYVEQLDNELDGIHNRIADLDTQITNKRAQIAETEEDLALAIGVQTRQYEAMKERIRFMYESGNTLTIDMLLQSGSFTDMLNKASYIKQLSEYDRMKLDEYIGVVQQVSLTKQALEEEKETLNEAISAQEAEQQNVQTLMTQKAAEIYGISQEIELQEQEIAAYQAMMQERDALLAKLEQEARQIEYRMAYDGGIFVWPCPNYTYISSDFAPRWGSFHKGVDMAAPAGVPILAAYNGVVAGCANDGNWNGGMGNYVRINHGSGLATIYMHASAVYVSKGQEVSAGDVIGAVGTTGWSTGNHLHFQVEQNGTAVTPWNYIRDPR